MKGCHWGKKYSGSVDLVAQEEGSFKGACLSGRGPWDKGLCYVLRLQVAWCSKDKGMLAFASCRAMIFMSLRRGFSQGYHTMGELGNLKRGMLYWVCRSENHGSMLAT